MINKQRKHFLKMLLRLIYLYFIKPADCAILVQKSYDKISCDYDESWTNHARDLTESLIKMLKPKRGDISIDLACGTGFSTNLIAQITQNLTTGVDISTGMLAQAQKNYGEKCEFINSDILEYLKGQSSNSADIITCCWGLGYSRPLAIIKQIKRVLKPGGKTGIIDNSLFSLSEILYCSFLTFAEQPEKLKNLMRFKFLTGCRSLNIMFRFSSLRPLRLLGGEKVYYAKTGKDAIERLISTGAAAGFEYAADNGDKEQIYERFAEIIEQKYMTEKGILIKHRYFAGIAEK